MADTKIQHQQFGERLDGLLWARGFDLIERPADSLIVDVTTGAETCACLQYGIPNEDSPYLTNRVLAIVLTRAQHGGVNQLVEGLLREFGIRSTPQEADNQTQQDFGMRYFYAVDEAFKG